MGKEILLEEIFDKLDLSQTMYDNATEKYHNIAVFLKEKGLDAMIYPQGSFSIGTVIRPYKDGKDKNYDLDFICQLKGAKDEFEPSEIKNSVGNILKNDGRYEKKIKEYDRCWTIEYADIADGIGFNIDIVPATGETEDYIEFLVVSGIDSRKAEKAIAITDNSDNNYKWISTNPAAYTEWFNEKNKIVFQQYIYKRKEKIFAEYRNLYQSIEEVPDYKVKTPLQRTIQILKRHRDIYYDRSKANDFKPASVIITTLLAEIADIFIDADNPSKFLNAAVNELRNMEEIFIKESSTKSNRVFKSMITRLENDKWEMKNPVNPRDNLLDCWNNKTANMFFKWLDEVKEDLLDNKLPSEYRDKKIMSSLGLGKENQLEKPYIRTVEPVKPWRN